MLSLTRGDKVWSGTYGRFVRFVRWEGSFAVVADMDMTELPDLEHAAHLSRLPK